jgi:hypothetical protein
MTARRLTINRSDMEAAKKLREKFYDKAVEKEIPISWSWPKELIAVGQSEAVQYTSDKWKKRGDYQDYKHVAEGPQHLFVKPGFLCDYSSRRRLELPGELIELPKRMPEAIAELAPILGIQFQSYKEPPEDLEDDEDYEYELSGEYYNVCVPKAYVGAACLPGTGETFLMIYTRADLCAIITGDSLNVEKDGIVG